jgi:hypothetical protein
VSLATHTRNVWQRACAQHGMGSIQAMLAVCHDLGKIRAYAKRSAGTWEVVGMHRALTLQIVLGLNGVLEINEPARRVFMRLLTALTTGAVPVDASDEERRILRECKGYDFGVSAEERAENRQERITAARVADLISAEVPALLGRLNVNRCLDASVAPEGLYAPDQMLLFLPEKTLRKHIASALPSEIVTELRLTDRSSGTHPATEFAVAVARRVFDLVDVVADRQATNGLFRVTSGTVAMPDVLALRTNALPNRLTKQWGAWKYEIDVA